MQTQGGRDSPEHLGIPFERINFKSTFKNHAEMEMMLVFPGEERGRCFTIEYVMPMNSQLTSESTVNVLSRCLRLSDLAPWLEQSRAGQREEARFL